EPGDAPCTGERASDVFDQDDRQRAAPLAPQPADGLPCPECGTPVKGTGPTPDDDPGAEDDDRQALAAVHFEKHLFGGSLCLGIQVTAMDVRIDRRGLVDDCPTAGVVTIDGARIV